MRIESLKLKVPLSRQTSSLAQRGEKGGGQNYSAKLKVFLKLVTLVFLLAILHFTLLTFNLEKAYAFSVGVYPPLIQIEALPQSKIETAIQIENLSPDPVSLQILLKPFKAGELENGQVAFLTKDQALNSPTTALFDYVQIKENNQKIETVELSPKQQKKLILAIDLPKNISLDDYYFSIVFLAKENYIQNTKSTSFAQGGLATNVLLTIGPKEKTKGLIEEFSVPFILKEGPVPFVLRIKNTGKSVIAPKGQIVIQNFFKQTVGKVEFLPVNILAGSTRSLPDTKQLEENISNYNSSVSTEGKDNQVYAFWPETFLLGPYTATLEIALSQQGPLFRRTIIFIGVPLQLLLIFGFIIVLAVLIKIRLMLLSRQQT